MMINNQRLQDIEGFYELMQRLEGKLGGKRRLADSTGRDGWPQRGVYFFFEDGEMRGNGSGLRVVRVGTHAVSLNSATTLWNRLSQHRGSLRGTGNHRGSIFRRHVGEALIARSQGEFSLPSWGIGSSPTAENRLVEADHERRVSEVIGRMPFLWVAIDDAPSSESGRAYIERNSIVLLAGSDGHSPADLPSAKWLGRYCVSPKIRASGLWNVNYVAEPDRPASYDAKFLTQLASYVDAMTSSD